jgi:type II secretory pathway pseudopilin PulG
MKSPHQLDRVQTKSGAPTRPGGEEGFMLLAVVVMVALLLIALSVAAPVVARQLRREKEVESQHRMEQYVRAIQLYQRKFRGQYPASIKVLEGSNNIRFLRHQYVDPLTGKADYKLIHQGEQKTKIHVFFGQELGGLTASLGSASGMASAGGTGTPIGGGSSTSTIGTTSALASGFSGASITTGTTGANGTTGAPGTNGTPGTTSSSDSTSALGDGTGGVIVGVGTSKSGTSITEPNGQGTYESWEYWYDPRIEMLKQGVSVTGGGMTSQPASSFGQNGVTGQPNSGGTGINGASGTPGTTSTPPTTTTPNPNSSTPNPF